MAVGVAANHGPPNSYTEDFLPDAILRRAHSAMEGSYVAHIYVYEIIFAEVRGKKSAV